MTRSRLPWLLAGLVAGLSGLATSAAVAAMLSIRASPVIAVAELVIRHTPGQVAEQAIATLQFYDKPFLIGSILALLLAGFALAGILGQRRPWLATAVFTVLAGVGAFAVLSAKGATPTRLLPVLVGYLTWQLVFAWLAAALAAGPRRADDGSEDPARAGAGRRTFLVRLAAVGAGTVVAVVVGRWLGRERERVEAARDLVRLDGVTMPKVPRGASVDIDGVAPWRTDVADFYTIHTVIFPPAVDPSTWQLRIHGMVDREVVVTYQDLLDRQLTESWITLNCVSNPVGGDLVGNAWWSGVRVADLLAEAGVKPGADAVLQTSQDGWNCGTPLTALTDGRAAMLAVAMNGRALPIEHGFPARTIVPGLYGFVSACKWVVDMEVTRFADFTAYWTDRGWAERGPVKMASRIDVPSSGAKVPSGTFRAGGAAWVQHTGIRAVEVQLDGGAWQQAELATAPNDDTWVQWAATLTLAPGDHELRVRAIDKRGEVQTGVRVDVVPDGATGWHSVDFVAES
ncbi:molybdopterin-dependent oxidoreductase [Nocardioides sp.]|uniref:molybdopterin-dependent oxidoreductase n=1 Tax=Nocardioides sp. TaxID=35761 RepID=UPI003527620F